MNERPSIESHTSRALITLVVASVLYYVASVASIDVLMSIPKPEWWFPEASKFIAGMSWLQFSHWLGVIVASLPFAIAIRVFPIRPPMTFAFCLAFLALVLPNFSTELIRLVYTAPLHSQLSATLDGLKFLATLPLLTWLLLQFPRRAINRR